MQLVPPKSDTSRPIRFHERIVFKSRPREMFLGKGIQQICSKFKVEHPC